MIDLRRAAATAGLASALVAAGAAAARPASAGPSAADVLGQRAVAYAAQEAGKPYVYGAVGPNAFDCSGLVQYVYRRLGVALPRTAQQQYAATPHVAMATARPGDVLFFRDASGLVTHDAIYAGGDSMWAAPHTGRPVAKQAIYSASFVVGDATALRPGVARRPPETASALPTVQTGASGPVVYELQLRLRVRADGVFGAPTKAALQAFQRAQRLTADGVVGPRTWTALLRATVPNPSPAPAPAPRPVAKPAPKPTPKPAAKPAPKPAPRPAPKPASAPVLQLGSRGAAVVTLQRLLHVSPVGIFGPQTRAAVLAFQRQHHLQADGVVGPQTWSALRAGR